MKIQFDANNRVIWTKELYDKIKELRETHTRWDTAKILKIPFNALRWGIEKGGILLPPKGRTIDVKEESYSNKNYDKILAELKRKPIKIHNYFPKNHIKIGILGDTHIGSWYSRIEFLEALYKIYKKEGIEHIYNVGDMVDGHKVYPGQEFEISHHGSKGQVEQLLKTYPRIGTTHYILGNHDLSFYKTAGTDIGELISEKRKDLIYEGKEEADILMQGIRLRLHHPGGGTAYAVSYRSHKLVESISGGEKPNIIAIGHFHKADFLPLLRNISVLQSGTLQSQTPFMRRHGSAAHLGGWIVEIWVNKKSVVRIRAEFVPFYER